MAVAGISGGTIASRTVNSVSVSIVVRELNLFIELFCYVEAQFPEAYVTHVCQHGNH